MWKSFLAMMLLAAASIVQAITLEIHEKEMRTYKVGETVTFTVTAYESAGKKLSAGKFRLFFRDSGGKNIKKYQDIDLSKGNPVTVTAKLDHPGFITLMPSACTMPDGSVVKWVRKRPEPFGGAAVEPEKIRAGSEKPADFDKFWADGIKQYEKVPVKVELTTDIKMKGYRCYRVTVDFPDKSGSVNGFLAVPDAPGKYPAVVTVPGAGEGVIGAHVAFSPKYKHIKLAMNVHPFKSATTLEEQKKLYADYNKTFAPSAYYYSNAEDRNKYIFRNVWLAINRSISCVTELKEFDGKNLAVTGGSQGGASALALGYLNKNITCVVANIPAFCDHHAWKNGRLEGWPKMHTFLKGKADSESIYFDGVHFASGITAPTLIGVGYVDVTCPPATVFAAYNNLKCPKKIVRMYRTGHDLTDEMRKTAFEFLNKEMSR